jgi:hypothetical protein
MTNEDLNNKENIDEIKTISLFDETYFNENIDLAKINHQLACEIYRNYMSGSQTIEERLERINRFRCG